MDKKILIYDVLDQNDKMLNSQVILDNNIGFEIPSDYFFDKDKTNLNKNKLVILNKNNNIVMEFKICNEDNYKNEINEIRKNYDIGEDFINYREQKILEYVDKDYMNILGFDGKVLVSLKSKCKKYSSLYYEMYFILYSFDSKCNLQYDNFYYQKNNFCILKNGYYIYNKFKLNLLKENVYDYLNKLNEKYFCDYLLKNKEFDKNIDNYYLPSTYRDIMSKVDGYKLSDDLSLRDEVEG